jgi:LNS2 (Lipin/Ned1/Smp2)
MRRAGILLLSASLLASCALNANVPAAPAAPAPAVAGGAPATAGGAPCAAPPNGYTGSYRHRRNRLYKSLGSPRFRGVDLIAMEDDAVQTLGGKLAYTAADKDVWDEDVDVYACHPDGWRYVERARTNREGRFEISLTGAFRLPPGMRDLFAHVPGHGGGVRFLAYVAPRGTTAVVSDIDGTLTESEDAIFNTVLFGDDVAHQPHAPRALADVAAGRPVIYVTSRGDQYTEVTRRWLALHGFPRGPVRLARSTITQPGAKTVAFKTGVLRALRIPVAVGIGNRASDIAAYANAGLSPSRILINLPEFASELGGELSAGKATAFDDYREVPALLGRPAPGAPEAAGATAAGAAAAGAVHSGPAQ